MKGITLFRTVDDARIEGFEVYNDSYLEYVIVCKERTGQRVFAIALRNS